MVLPTRAHALVCGLVAACTAGCTPIDSGSSTGAIASVDPAEVRAPADAQPTARVITTLQTRDHEVTVYASPDGPSFTIAAAGGTVLAERLSGDEFRRSFPGLREHYDAAFAEDSAGLDARVALPRDRLDDPRRDAR